MNKGRPIVVTGSIAIDRIMSFNGRYVDHILPDKIDVLSVSVFIDKLTDSYGGVGANIAYSLALLGEEPYLLGSVGKDAVSYMEHLALTGVNITHVHESSLPTASFNAFTDSDQNQISGFYPGAMFDSGTLSLSPWKNSNPIVIISPHDPKSMKMQVNECRRWGLKYCYDIGQQVSNAPADDIYEGIETAEILILNEYEIETLSKRTDTPVDKIKDQVPIVITTLGKIGSIIEGNTIKSPIKIGIAKPDNVVDPTGAGDAFRAGFFYGYSRSWELKDCAQLGAVCGSYAIEKTGTQDHIFSLDYVAKRYLDNFNEHLPKK
jgi:adenosine kinase